MVEPVIRMFGDWSKLCRFEQQKEEKKKRILNIGKKI